jgi:archaeosine-15-forming tRNA-guanine transglycosylase
MAHFAFAQRHLNGNEAHSTSFIPDYADEEALANDPAALVDHLDTLLASGQLTDATKNNIVQTIDSHPADQ